MTLMPRAAMRIASGALLMGLVACSHTLRMAPYAFDVQLDPQPITLNVALGPEGRATYAPSAHVLRFASKAGAVGATIEGYEIFFYEASGNPAFPGDAVLRSRGSLNLYVPPGLSCDQLLEDETFDGCTVNSPGAAFRRGPVRPPLGQAENLPTTTLVPEDVARELYRLVGVGGAVGAYANLYFYGTDDLQRPFRSGPYQVAIIVGQGP
ncbi:hypothetical protein Trad_2637 [Truepera radiovictrix DSM 17093]|uniref:Lipoprotein n=2 Tax=Truepera TaxID=332248 RepID=D7CUF8_TRURR|nr:hypothetical protein Trad_2637 [Truepera radiovictrix DSM 17093]